MPALGPAGGVRCHVRRRIKDPWRYNPGKLMLFPEPMGLTGVDIRAVTLGQSRNQRTIVTGNRGQSNGLSKRTLDRIPIDRKRTC